MVFSQPDIQANLKYLDSVEYVLRAKWCNNILTYENDYKAKQIKKEKTIVYFLNYAYSVNVDRTDVLDGLLKMKDIRIGKIENQNGLITINTIILNSSYLHVELRIESIDNLIFRKKLSLTTTTSGSCDVSRDRVLDLRLLKKIFINDFHHRFEISSNRELFVNEFIDSNLLLVEKKHQGYKVSLPSEKNPAWLNELLSGQYDNDSACCYKFNKADKRFVKLISNGQIDIINDLLFSPNNFYAINAMEALIFLSKENKIRIDESTQVKIDSIKQNHFSITAQFTYDLFKTFNGYLEMGVVDQDIVNKYQDPFR